MCQGLGRDGWNLTVLELLLGLLVLVDEFEVEFGDFTLRHAEDPARAVSYTSELARIEGKRRSTVLNHFLYVEIGRHAAATGPWQHRQLLRPRTLVLRPLLRGSRGARHRSVFLEGA